MWKWANGEFGDEVIELHYGKHHDRYVASFELNNELDNANSIIKYFCLLIENFEPKGKKIWDEAHNKVFDIGYQTDLNPRYYQSNIEFDTIQAVSRLQASLTITIYPPEKKS